MPSCCEAVKTSCHFSQECLPTVAHISEWFRNIWKVAASQCKRKGKDNNCPINKQSRWIQVSEVFSPLESLVGRVFCDENNYLSAFSDSITGVSCVIRQYTKVVLSVGLPNDSQYYSTHERQCLCENTVRIFAVRDQMLHHYLSKGGFHPCLFVCLFICQQYYTKTNEQWDGLSPEWTPLSFGVDLGKRTDPGIFFLLC